MSVNGKAQGLSALDHFPTVNHDTDKSAADEQIARTSSNEAHEYEAKDFDTACKLAVQKSSEPISIDEAKTELHCVAVYLRGRQYKVGDFLYRVLERVNASWPEPVQVALCEIRKISTITPLDVSPVTVEDNHIFLQTDIASERLIAETLGSRDELNQHVRFVVGENCPRIWNGCYWAVDNGPVPRRLAEAVHLEVVNLIKLNKIDLRNASRLESMASMRSVLQLLKSYEKMLFQPSELDPPYFLVCPNGVLDLKTGKLLPHSSERAVTKCTGVKYVPSPISPEWNAIQNHLETLGIEDYQIIHRYIGASILGLPPDRKLLWLKGAGGDGKSTLWRAIAGALGAYAGTVPEEIIAHKGGRGAHGHELMSPLNHCRIVCLPEVPSDVNWTVLKALSGADDRTTKRMHSKKTEEKVRCHLFILSNESPMVPHGDQAVRERLILINWHKPTETDPYLVRTLATEGPERTTLLQACLNWVVLGAAEFLIHGYSVREREPIGYLAPEGLAAWWEEGITTGFIVAHGGWTTAKEVELVINKWAKDNGYEEFSPTAIGVFLKTRVSKNPKKDSPTGRCVQYQMALKANVRTMSGV